MSIKIELGRLAAIAILIWGFFDGMTLNYLAAAFLAYLISFHLIYRTRR